MYLSHVIYLDHTYSLPEAELLRAREISIIRRTEMITEERVFEKEFKDLRLEVDSIKSHYLNMPSKKFKRKHQNLQKRFSQD